MSRKRKLDEGPGAEVEGNMHLRNRKKEFSYSLNMDDFLPDNIFDSDYGMSLMFGSEFVSKHSSQLKIKPVKNQTKTSNKSKKKSDKKNLKHDKKNLKPDEIRIEPKEKKRKTSSDTKNSKTKPKVKSAKKEIKNVSDENIQSDKKTNVKLDRNDIKSLIHGINVMEQDMKSSKNKLNSEKERKSKNTGKNDSSCIKSKPDEKNDTKSYKDMKTKSKTNKELKSKDDNKSNSKNKVSDKSNIKSPKINRKSDDKSKNESIEESKDHITKSDSNKTNEIKSTSNKRKATKPKPSLAKSDTNAVKSKNTPRKVKGKGDSKENDVDDVLITGESSGSQERKKFRTKLSFLNCMEEEVLDEEMLSDMTINYSLLLLHKQFPSIKGLEDTELGPKGLFSQQNGNFIQILFADTHWLLACVNGSTPKDQVYIFNSKSDGTLSNEFIKQTFLLRPRNKRQRTLTLSVQSVQQQRNDTDCGPLALCYAVDLMFKKNPVGRHYDLLKLREHLFQCLKNGKFTVFPITVGTSRKIRLNVCDESKIKVNIHCSCKGKACCFEKEGIANDVILCSRCQGIFFRTCGDIPEEYFHKEMIDAWSCVKCASKVQKIQKSTRLKR